MRRLYRQELPLATRVALARRGDRCSDVQTARQEWKAFRPLAEARPLVDELRRMAGVRDRCFYCSDSRGTDVDHYAPIDSEYASTFVWRNHLWACTDCNRRKSTRFPVDPDLGPLVIDPTRTDAWAHLALADTGVIAPKVHPGDVVDVRGLATLDVLNRINHEAVVEGRYRMIRRLRRAASDVLASGNTMPARRRMIEEVREDDFGVFWWFVRWEGRQIQPFSELWIKDPALWRRLTRLTVAQQHGR